MSAVFTDDGQVRPDVERLFDELNERDAEAGSPGRALLTTDDVRRALLGVRRVKRPGMSVPAATMVG